MRSRCAKTAIWLAFTAAFWLGAMPALAQPTLIVFNPHPNDRVITGSLVMQGVAYDPDSADGPGIDRVSVRVCGRDGNFLGDAVLGLPSGVSLEKGDPRFAHAGWKVTVPLKGAGEIRSLCVTALGSLDGDEVLVRIPLTIGETPPPPSGPNPDEAPEVTPPEVTPKPATEAAVPTTGKPASNGSTAAPTTNGSASTATGNGTSGTPTSNGATGAPAGNGGASATPPDTTTAGPE